MSWSRESVDVQVSHHLLNLVKAKILSVKARHLYELVVVGQALQ